jgi:hypothetical protein
MRTVSAAVLFAAALLASAAVQAQRWGSGRRAMIEDNTPPATEFVISRWRYGTNGRIGHMGWSHNYPDSEINLNEFIGRTTRVQVESNSYRLLELGSPEIFEYPFVYVSEPGEMELTDQELHNIREYIERGGFILIDDFDGDHIYNLREEMARAFPDRTLQRLTIDNPIFDLVFKVEDLLGMAPYVPGGDPVYYGLVNAHGDIAIVACHNNDIANFWEWYGSPWYPLKPATDAFRMGANFLIHAMTH